MCRWVGINLTNRSTGPSGKTYQKIIVNWSIFVMSDVESTDNEGYFACYISEIIIFNTFVAIRSMNSSHTVDEKYETCTLPLFTLF